jgi:excisionase family DNA binding protein
MGPMADESNSDRLLVTVEEAARQLSIGRSHLYELILRGTLRSIRIGRTRRIATRDIEAFIDALLQDTDDVSPASERLAVRPVKKSVPEAPRRR